MRVEQMAGMITDRDVCMAAYTQGKPLKAIPVSQAMGDHVVSWQPGQSIDEAHGLADRRSTQGETS